MEHKYKYEILKKLYNIQIINRQYTQGILISTLARELNLDFQIVYNRCYKYTKRNFYVRLFGNKGAKKVIISKDGIDRIEWLSKEQKNY